MLRFPIFLRRLFRRLRRLRELWSWEYESCQDCGTCYRLVADVDDDLWREVMGGPGGTLCPECFVRRAGAGRADLSKMRLWVFFPED